MPYREPTRAEVEAAETAVLIRRGERLRAAEAAAKAEAEAVKLCPPPDRPQPQPIFETEPRRLTESQVQEAAAAYRANYANCDEELRNLMEARLTAALKADGYAVPPVPVADRLRALKARQLRES
jgi:hypothetical protein